MHAFAELLTLQPSVRQEFGHTDYVVPDFKHLSLVLLLQWPPYCCADLVFAFLPRWSGDDCCLNHVWQPHSTDLTSWCFALLWSLSEMREGPTDSFHLHLLLRSCRQTVVLPKMCWERWLGCFRIHKEVPTKQNRNIFLCRDQNQTLWKCNLYHIR